MYYCLIKGKVIKILIGFVKKFNFVIYVQILKQIFNVLRYEKNKYLKYKVFFLFYIIVCLRNILFVV